MFLCRGRRLRGATVLSQRNEGFVHFSYWEHAFLSTEDFLSVTFNCRFFKWMETHPPLP